MDQISPPMRIVLAVAVVFLAAWMLVLKPKGSDTSAPASTPATPATASAQDDNKATTGLGKAVEAARGAKDATEAEQDKEGLGTPGKAASAPSTSSATAAKPSATSAPSAPAKPVDPALAKLPGWLQRSMDKKVVAILFTNGRSADDRRTGRALRHAFTAHGQVVTRAVPLSRIARYRPVASGVDVRQSPTLVVIDRDRSAQSLVGFSTVATINQAIVDGLLATDRPVKHVAFLKDLQSECRDMSRAAVIGPLDHALAVMGSSLVTLRNTPAPARYRPLKGLALRYIASEQAIGRQLRSADPVESRRLVAGNDRLQHRALIELNAVGVSSCN